MFKQKVPLLFTYTCIYYAFRYEFNCIHHYLNNVIQMMITELVFLFNNLTT